MILNLAFYILAQSAVHVEMVLPTRPKIEIILEEKKKRTADLLHCEIIESVP